MKIIVAPLNWGIGHATRMIPVIDFLHKQGAIVHLASDGEALAVLRKAFPDLDWTALPSYNIQYKHKKLFKNSVHLAANMLRTIPKEKKAISALVTSIQADVIISDNRFGCYADNIKNIFVTHQLQILAGALASKSANIVNRHYMKNFQEIWVPDMPNEPSLAGKLSHVPDQKVTYIGGLSRFEKLNKTPKTIDVLAILSGPEPQRSFLEKRLLAAFGSSKLKTVIVRGKPLAQAENTAKKLKIIDYASTNELLELIGSSRVIISRSGYSTIMDYAALGLFSQLDTQLIFIPTPGQPEQVYLAKKMQDRGLVHSVGQDEFNLISAMEACAKLTSTFDFAGKDYLSSVLKTLLTSG